MSIQRWSRAAQSCVCGCLVGWAACAAAPGPSEPASRGRAPAGSTAGQASVAPPPAPPPSAASAAPVLPTASTPLPMGSEPMQLSDDEVCDAASYSTQRMPLDIYMMIDDSASMIPWWPATLEALDMFFADPASAGIGVGMQFFGTACDPALYAAPLVEIAELPANADPLRAAFPLIPVDETATLPALQGAIAHARQWGQLHADHKVVVLLVTDGLPEECSSTVENVTEVAREGFEGTPSVLTFVVGIGDLGAIDQFAKAGGTNKALQTLGGVAGELVQSFNAIRSAALPCDFALPSAEASAIERDRVNLRYTGPDGQPVTIGAVPDAARCDAERGGWYFDDATAPSRLLACEQSCKQLNAGGEVKILLGCPTVTIQPS